MAAIGALTPIATIGLVADPQYKSNAPNGNVEGRCQRYCEVPDKLTQAVQDWQSHAPAMSMVLNLGDTIDGQDTVEGSQEDLDTLAQILEPLDPIPVICVVGNHDLAATRAAYVGSFKLPGSYFSLEIAPGWRLLVLDTTDLSTGSDWPEGSSQLQEARAFKAAHEAPLEDWNGGLTSGQLAWLDQQLAGAEHAGEKVIVASHHPIGRGSARPTHMAWNAPDMEKKLTDSRCVVLALAGHDHEGGHAVIKHVHFVTVEAMLEAPEGSNAYGFIRLFQDHIEIKGVGSVTSRKLLLPSHLISV